MAPRLVAHLQYLAAVTTLCPIVALLGAKRPQNRAWQWIVSSLLVLLALPSLKSLAFDGGIAPDPHAAWRWLILIIALSGFMNYLPTRQALSAGLFFCGQAILLADYLPGAIWSNVAEYKSLGLAFLSAAVVAAYLLAGMRTSADSPEDRLWLDFRNAFGALWALRVAERFNSVAAQNTWRIRLSWNGLQPISQQQSKPVPADVQQTLPPELHPAVRQTLRSLLRRFVSAEWIAVRLGPAQGEV